MANNMTMKKIPQAVLTIIGSLITIIPSLFKKKLYCLWYQGRDGKWILKGGPMSHRQCVKTMNELVELGTYLSDRFVILRKGVSP